MPRKISYPQPQLLAISAPTFERREDCSRGTTWPNHEIEWLIQHYGRFPIKFIAGYLRRSELSIRLKMCRIRKQRSDRKPKLGNVSRFTVAAE